MTSSPTEPRRALKVLVVDDNKDAADSLRMLLDIWGYDARVAYDGESGLETARAYAPDCFVLDIGLPGMDGYTLARRIRDDAGFKGVKLVALTAYSHDEHVARARDAGFDHLLVKTGETSELQGVLTMLSEVMKLANKTEELARQNVALATETKELITEVKKDLKEVKEEVKEIKDQVREVKKTLDANGK